MASYVLRLSATTVNTSLQARLEQESSSLQQSHRESDAAAVDLATLATGKATPDEEVITSRSICLSVQELFTLERMAQLRLMPPPPPQSQRADTPVIVDGAAIQTEAPSTEVVSSSDSNLPPTSQQQQPLPPPPPTGTAAPSAAQSGARNRELERMLGVLEVPFLELAFIPPDMREDLITTEPREALRVVIDSLFSFQESIRWNQLSSADSDLLLRLLTTTPQGTNLALTLSEVDKIKRLPLFELLSGE